MNPEEQKVLEQLRREIDIFAAVDVRPETVLQSLPHWDSLAILLVIQHAEVSYGLTLSGTQIRKCHTLQDLLQLLLSR
jgi:acyl carrier protein